VTEEQMDIHNLKSLWNFAGMLRSFVVVGDGGVLLNRARLKSIISLKKLKIVMSSLVRQ